MFWLIFCFCALFYFLRFLWEILPVGDMKNRVVFITGCDTGFGRLLSLKCARNGIPTFAGCYSLEGRKNLAQDSIGFPGKLITVPLDVTDDSSVEEAAAFVKKQLLPDQKLWALVNNAGVFSCHGPDAWSSVEQYKNAFDVNTLGMIRCTHAFLNMLKESQGRIISVSSVCGRVSIPCMGPYNIAKYGVEAYMDTIRQELHPYGIKCSILEPGTFRTPLIDYNSMKQKVDDAWDQLNEEVKNEYGEEFKNKFISRMNSGMHLIGSDRFELVVNSYFHAITAKFPRCRYRCGLDSIFFYIPLSFMPTEVYDFILRVVIGQQTLKGLLETKPKGE